MRKMKINFSGLLLWALLLTLAHPFAEAHAASDGFVLTTWGSWALEDVVPAIKQARKAGARSIAVMVNLCQESRTSNELWWCDATPSVPFAETAQGVRLKLTAEYLTSQGLSVSLIPMVGTTAKLNAPSRRGAGSGFDSKHWSDSRQFTRPMSAAQWFRHYGSLMTELTGYARTLGINEIIVGSELTLLFTEEGHWRALIRQMRQIHPQAHLTISAVAWQFLGIRFWDALDSIGISAYFPLDEKNLVASWSMYKYFLLSFAVKNNKPLSFVEIGYPATEVAASQPWDYNWPARHYEPGLQKRCFEAFAKTWRNEPLLRSFHIWGLTADPREPLMGFNPLGKPAEAVVKSILKARQDSIEMQRRLMY